MDEHLDYGTGVKFNEIFGIPDELSMKWGRRWKFNHGYFVDYSDGSMQYSVNRAGRPTENIDRVLSFHDAKLSMLAHWEDKGKDD
jgi:hypothetical protein